MPLHPSLVHFPIGLLTLGALAALIDLWRPLPWLKGWGLVSLLAGWLLTIPAVVSGLIEKTEIGRGTAAEQLADLHTTGMFVMWALFGLAAYLLYLWRRHLEDAGKKWWLTLILLLAPIVMLVASHLGGRLVFELGVGVR